jgi:hypothetical protein
MFYKEFLRIRNIFAGFAIAMVLLALFIFAMAGHAHVKVSADPGNADSHGHAALHAVALHEAAPHEQNSGGSTTVIGPNVDVSSNDFSRAPASILLALAGFVAAIFATVLGTCLAAENCGHLEIAWTRPASRTAYAAGLMLVDGAGILAMFAFTLLVSIALVYASGWQHSLDMDPNAGTVLARFLLYPFAWFGLIAALTASVRGRAGGIAGFSWLGGGLLIVLLTIDLPPSIHAVVQALNYLNPMLYGSFSSGAEAARHVMQTGSLFAVGGLAGITILGIIAALAQWRRLEA